MLIFYDLDWQVDLDREHDLDKTFNMDSPTYLFLNYLWGLEGYFTKFKFTGLTATSKSGVLIDSDSKSDMLVAVSSKSNILVGTGSKSKVVLGVTKPDIGLGVTE